VKYAVPKEQMLQAKHPHELFLINLIFNHILLFVAFISASSLQHFVVVVPLISSLILSYTLWRSRRSRLIDPWFVMCHWQVAARRSRLFLTMLGIMAVALVLLWILSEGHPKPQHWAFAGIAILPTMVTVLALVIMESDAMHQAAHGMMPNWASERYPNPEALLLDDESERTVAGVASEATTDGEVHST